MAMKKKARHGFRISRFYAIYLTVTIAVVLIIIAALGIVSNRLAEFEAAQPKYVAAEVFAKYFGPIASSGNYNELFGADADTVRYDAGGAGITEIIAYIQSEIGDSELTYSIGSSPDPDEQRYIVKAGEKQLASITLVPGEATQHGYKTYEFSYIELYLNTTAPPDDTVTPSLIITIDAPSSYAVAVDGRMLTIDDITSSHTREGLLKYYPSGITGVDYTVYTLTTLEDLPAEVIVTDLEGTLAGVTFDADTNTYTAGVTYSTSLSAEYTEFVTEAIEKYAAYVHRGPGVSLGAVAAYFDESSDAYADVEAQGNDRWMEYEPSGIEYENVSVGEFFSFSSNIFSCRVSFKMVAHKEGKEDYIDVIDKYIFLHMTEDGYKIYEWYNA